MFERAVILAAGLGLRLNPLTNGAPKCLTEVNGTPILFNALRNLSALGIKYCTLVVGYLSPVIRETVGSNFEGIRLDYIENEVYRSTNDMYSLWLARGVVEQGVVVLEGDIFFRAAALARALDKVQGRSCYLAGSYDGRANEVLVLTDSHLRVLSVEVLYGQGARPGSHRYVSCGMLLLQPGYGKCLSRWLTRSVEAGRVDVLFDQIISEHVAEEPLYVVEVDRGEWVEIDTPEDLAQAERVFH
jgi:choline kinase